MAPNRLTTPSTDPSEAADTPQGALLDEILCMKPEPDEIVRLAQALYRTLDAPAGTGMADGDRAQAGRAFSAGLTQALLNWMGHGDVEAVERFADRLREVLSEEGEAAPLASLPMPKRLASRLNEAGRLARAYLTTNNEARILALLDAPRRDRWRSALEWAHAWAHEEGRPFRTRDLQDSGVLESRSSANTALNEMVDLGLLVKTKETIRDVRFQLSWEAMAALDRRMSVGDRTAQAAALREREEAHAEVQRVRAELGALRREVLKTRKDLFRLRMRQGTMAARRTAAGASIVTKRMLRAGPAGEGRAHYGADLDDAYEVLLPGLVMGLGSRGEPLETTHDFFEDLIGDLATSPGL